MFPTLEPPGSRVKADRRHRRRVFLLIASKALRRTLRERRSALAGAERESADRQLRSRVTTLPEFQRARNLAAYLACGGEYDPAAVIAAAWEGGKTVYLPVLMGRAQPMLFAPYEPESALQPNWLGIPEPVVDPERLCEPAELDLVLTPLVGFDAECGRLGMGGGYYDRSFAFLNGGSRGRPCLLGVAYEVQKLTSLMQQPWDVRLDAVATELRLYQRPA